VIKSRIMRWGEPVIHMGERKGAYSFLVKREEGRPPVRSRHRWEDYIGMELKPVGSGVGG
jgi:hypothetical protein